MNFFSYLGHFFITPYSNNQNWLEYFEMVCQIQDSDFSKYKISGSFKYISIDKPLKMAGKDYKN